MQPHRTLIFIVVLALLVAGCAPAGAAATSTFKTPEDAVNAYFDGLKQNDVPKILQACAIDEMSEKFDFAGYVERLGGTFPPSIAPAPTSSPLYVEVNKAQLTAQILNRVKLFTYSLLSSEKVDDGHTIMKMDSTRVSNFLKEADPQRLAKLEVKQIAVPDQKLMNTAKYLENAAKNARVYGADESTERVALFTLDGNYYYVGFALLRYGDNWKINMQVSPLANTNALGTPIQATQAEFEKVITP